MTLRKIVDLTSSRWRDSAVHGSAERYGQAKQGSSTRGTLVVAGMILLILTTVVIGIEFIRRMNRFNADGPQPITPREVPGAFPRELQDGSGAGLIIRSRPQRIASQTLGTDEILIAICPPERIVGLSSFARDDRYSNVAEEARSMSAQVVEGPEQVLRLEPDLIFVASYSRAEFVDLLRSAGAPVFRFSNFDRIEHIKSNIRVVGYAVGEEDKAEALVSRMDEQLEAVRSRRPVGKKRPRVVSYGVMGFTAGANTLFDGVVRAAGAVNISAEHGINGFKQISAEQVASWQPEFIVTGSEVGRFDEIRQRLLANPAIRASEAGRTGRIIVLDNRHFLTVSHHIVRAVEALAAALESETLEPEK